MARKFFDVFPWAWPWGMQDRARHYVDETKASAAGPLISAGYVGQPVWTPRNYTAFAKEAYVENAVAHRCVKLIATAAASAPWLLTGPRGREFDERHPYLKLLRRPGPMVGGADLFEAFYSYLLIDGNGYLEAVGPNDSAPPQELWAPRADRMKVIPSRFGTPMGYEYEANGLTKKWDVDPFTGKGPILHVRQFHPLNDWYGLGSSEPAAFGVDRHNAASAHNKALLDNGARPSGALVFEPIKKADGSMVTAPPEAITEAEKTLKKSHGGARKAGKPMVFGGLVNWLEMGITPKDMDFNEGKLDAARDICLSYGVPHILIVPGAQTYNNVREAKVELWEDTVLPLLDKTVDALDAWLSPQFGDGLKLGVDLDAISALEPRRESKRKTVLDQYDKNLLTSTEAREALQYGPRDAQAVGKVDAATLKALIAAAKSPAGVEPLYRYMLSVGLLPPDKTLETFSADWDASDIKPEDLTDNPAPKDPAATQEDNNAAA